MAHKFGNEYKEEQPKINVIDNKLGKEIIERIKTSQYLEQKILNELEDYNKELRATRRRLNNIKNTLEKESYTIVLYNTLEQAFDTPINCENCEIALVEFNALELFIIDETNNSFDYDFGDGWRTFKVKEGYYTINSLQSYINKTLILSSDDIIIDGSEKSHLV